jgi:hypothetical protein
MKRDSLRSFMVRVILAGIIIFFISASGCIQYSTPYETATLPTITFGGMPARTDSVTPAATLSLSPRSMETPIGVPARRSGSLVIWSSPPASSVYIDGMYVGDTPAVRGSFTKVLSIGPHAVTITKIGYEDYREQVYVSEGETLVVTATLPEKTFPWHTLNPTSTFTESLY